MTWRLAQSLVVLRDEVWTVSPGQTVYTIGDASHAASASDHNPNAEGVVCAIDIMQGNGLDLGAMAEKIRARRHPAGKYVIHNRQIASASQAWAWRPYGGSDPHTDHIHVSVGVGPDGQSTGPYDDTSPWGVAPQPEEEEMSVKLIAPDAGYGKGGVYKVYPTPLGMALEPLDGELGAAVALWGQEVHVQDARKFGTPIEELRAEWERLAKLGAGPTTVTFTPGPMRLAGDITPVEG